MKSLYFTNNHIQWYYSLFERYYNLEFSVIEREGGGGNSCCQELLLSHCINIVIHSFFRIYIRHMYFYVRIYITIKGAMIFYNKKKRHGLLRDSNALIAENGKIDWLTQPNFLQELGHSKFNRNIFCHFTFMLNT